MKTPHTHTALASALLILLTMATPPLLAADKPSREKQALQRTQQALREAQAERDALQGQQAGLSADKTKLEAEAGRLSGEVRRLSSQQQTQSRVAQAAQARASELESANAKLQAQLAEAQSQNTALSGQLSEAQARLRSVTALLAGSTQTQALLEQRNTQLYQAGLAAIDMFRSKSPADTWLQQVSMLGLGEVQADNAAEALRTRLDEARYLAPTAAGPGTSATP